MFYSQNHFLLRVVPVFFLLHLQTQSTRLYSISQDIIIFVFKKETQKTTVFIRRRVCTFSSLHSARSCDDDDDEKIFCVEERRNSGEREKQVSQK